MKNAATKKALVKAIAIAVIMLKGEGRPNPATVTVSTVSINSAIQMLQSCMADAM